MMDVFLALGSNLGDRHLALENAIKGLDAGGVKISLRSSIYETAPMYVADQPAFLNMAVGGETDLSPFDTLDLAKRLERQIGRVPSFRNGPRAVDIDLLYFGDCRIDEPRLTLPHPRIDERAFVLAPLSEIAPDLIGPGDIQSVKERFLRVAGRAEIHKLGNKAPI